MSKLKLAVAAGVCLAAAMSCAAPVSASTAGDTGRVHWQERYVTLRGATAPGPAVDNRIGVLQVGDRSARRVLVLEAGWGGAAGDFRVLAEDLARQLRDTQVWAVDRRDQDLADLSGFTKGPTAAADYYLNGRYTAQTPRTTPYVGRWGLGVELADLHQVVLAALDHGHRRVVLGGHSWGATTALAYAAWDFAGRAGYSDLSGLVLIDGGMHDAFAGEGAGDVYRVTTTQARAMLRKIAAGQVFDPTFDLNGRPETLAILTQLAGQYALSAPHAPSALQPLLPEALRPPIAVTNQGLLGWLFDTHALDPALSVHSGHLAANGDWADQGPTPVSRLAKALAGPVPAGLQWYFPQRLSLDLQAADPYADTPVTRLLGLRLWHTRQVNVPLYSFQTGLTHGTANTAARWVVANSRIREARYAEDPTMSHLDPLYASPQNNTLLKTLVPFLNHLDH